MSKFNFAAWIKDTRKTWLEKHEIDLTSTNLRVGQKPQKKNEEIIKTQFDYIDKHFHLANNKLDNKFDSREFQLFKSAVTGAGNEWKEIDQLNSSTLLAYLCFCQVPKKPLTIDCGDESVKFTNVHFEVANNLPSDGRSHPRSNMDIVLTGNNKGGKIIKLFLESKFTEYTKTTKSLKKLPEYYSKRYTELFGKNNEYKGLRWSIDNESCYWEVDDTTPHYLEGIKQMVSHYLGLKNEIENGKYDGVECYLGEILFKFDKKFDKENSYEKYKQLHANLCEMLNCSQGKSNKINIIKGIFSYQDIFKGERLESLPAEVREFYFNA